MLLSRIVPSLRAVLLIATLLSGAAACRSAADASAATSVAPGHAICPVCAADGDLACQDVTIRTDTASTVRDGITYYFCSAECRRKFERDPGAYLAR
jgi:YHS domain-containing protein